MTLSMGRTRTILAAVLLLGALGLRPGAAQAAPPGPVTQVAPAGGLTGTTITFTWEAAPGATWYFIQVNDATTVGKLLQWYTAEQANCPGGVGTCAITVSQGLVGAGTWWIRPWNPEGFGPWSPGLQFRVAALPPIWAGTITGAERFVLVLGGAGVVDRETGLVWRQVPGAVAESFGNAQFGCAFSSVGGRYGWRLPTIEELTSLFDQSGGAPPFLPPGHPFAAVANAAYWSTTDYTAIAGNVFVVNFFGIFTSAAKSGGSAVRWCVRGGVGPIN